MSERPSPDFFSPYPEIVLGNPSPYDIFETDDMADLPAVGMTNKANGALYVPLSAAGQAVRRHEQGHVKWSPETIPRTRHNVHILLAVEDARVNIGLARVGLPIEFSDELRRAVIDHARAELAADGLASVTLRAVAGLGTNAATDLLEVIKKETSQNVAWATSVLTTVRRRLDRSATLRRRPVASFEQARRVARWLSRQLADKESLPERNLETVICGCFDGTRSGVGDRPFGDTTLGAILDCDVRPGRMRVTTPPLTRVCRTTGPGFGRAFRPRLEGTVVAYPWEFHTSRRIFRQSVRSRGATVLIDASGSMDLSADAIESILSASPAAATVAMYSGHGDEGELRIVGRGNRHADAAHLEPFGRGNVVDVPALRWLARQTGPRIWISDGAVTGEGDAPSERVRLACRRIRRNNGIVRVESAEAALPLVAGTGSTPRAEF